MKLEVNAKRTERLSRELAEALSKQREIPLTPEQALDIALTQAWMKATGKSYYEAFILED